MAEISKIQLPNGNVYELKDAVARQAIAGGITYVIAWDGESTPDITKIPKNVKVVYNNISYTGILEAAQATPGSFYLVWQSSDIEDHYAEYAVVKDPDTDAGIFWEKLGDVKADLTGLVTGVTLSKGSGDVVLGKDTTFTAGTSSVSFGSHTTDKVLGVNTGFTVTDPTISVTPTITNVKATASGTAVGANGTESFVKSYPGTSSKLVTTEIKGVDSTDTATLVTNKTSKKLVTTAIKGVAGTTTASDVTHTSKKLQTTTVPNVTGNTDATLTFALGTGNDSETLIIGGSGFASNTNTYTASKTTLGTAKTVATGTLVDTSTSSNVGGTIVDSVTETSRTVATAAASNTTVATGALAATSETSNVGATIVESFDTADKTLATAASTTTTVATGSLNSNGGGSSVMTGLGTPTTGTGLTGVRVTVQPTIALETGATAGTGVISVATGISSASASGTTVTSDSADEVDAITALGSATAAPQTITVGSNDEVTVARYSDLNVNVTTNI